MCEETTKESLVRKRTYGFRFSLRDGIAIIIITAMTIGLWNLTQGFSAICALALGHFFLFCNIFRVRRSLELIWAGIFVLNVFAWALMRPEIWLKGVLMVQIPVTVTVILIEMFSPRYHGIMSKRINKRLDDYLNEEI